MHTLAALYSGYSRLEVLLKVLLECGCLMVSDACHATPVLAATWILAFANTGLRVRHKWLQAGHNASESEPLPR